jgi:hypothetical protein
MATDFCSHEGSLTPECVCTHMQLTRSAEVSTKNTLTEKVAT